MDYRPAPTVSTPTGNVVNDPDSIYGPDGRKLPKSERRQVNSHNIVEDWFQGNQKKRKYGKLFDDAAATQEHNEQFNEDDVSDEVIDAELGALMADDEEFDGVIPGESAEQELSEYEKARAQLAFDDEALLFMQIKELVPRAKHGDVIAENLLLDITSAEYARPSSRRKIVGLLSSAGYKKPGR